MKSLITAFSMYSKIPMPQIEWNERSMRYTMCYFPMIGIVIGLVIFLWGHITAVFGINKLLFSTVITVIPIIITGGIHMDGFIDTADALSSYGDTKKRLEIMKDPHTGAFAIIWTCVYFIMNIGIWSEISVVKLPTAAVIFAISRSLSGISVICFKKAKDTGIVSMFADAAQKRITISTLFLWLILCVTYCAVIDLKSCIAICIASTVAFLIHYINCKKNFGGITGDLAGFFLQLCELLSLASFIFVK